ncbi:hypothetical protein B0H19DRAFT_1383609 [Mycena capillaripes]|nr:hypothetical protein B0H19DRAFT_1383609 [Mycena capillaripes]
MRTICKRGSPCLPTRRLLHFPSSSPSSFARWRHTRIAGGTPRHGHVDPLPLLVSKPATGRAPLGRTGPQPPPTPLPQSPPPAISAAPQHENRNAAHEGVPEAQAQTTRGFSSSTTAPSVLYWQLRGQGYTLRWQWAVISGDAEFWGFSLACFGTRGSAERAFPSMGGVLLCGTDTEVVHRGPALACGCADVAPAFFDALYALHERPVWALCSCPSIFVQHALRSALLHVGLAGVGDLAGILILLREGGGVSLGLSHFMASHPFPLTGNLLFPVRAGWPAPSPLLVGRMSDE